MTVCVCTNCGTKLIRIEVVFNMHSTCRISKKSCPCMFKNFISQDWKHLALCTLDILKLLVDCYGRRQVDCSSAELQTKMAAARRSTTTRCWTRRETTPLLQNTETNLTLQMFQMVWPVSKWLVKVRGDGWWWCWWWCWWWWRSPRLLSSTRGPRCPGTPPPAFYSGF